MELLRQRHATDTAEACKHVDDNLQRPCIRESDIEAPTHTHSRPPNLTVCRLFALERLPRLSSRIPVSDDGDEDDGLGNGQREDDKDAFGAAQNTESISALGLMQDCDKCDTC